MKTFEEWVTQELNEAIDNKKFSKRIILTMMAGGGLLAGGLALWLTSQLDYNTPEELIQDPKAPVVLQSRMDYDPEFNKDLRAKVKRVSVITGHGIAVPMAKTTHALKQTED